MPSSVYKILAQRLPTTTATTLAYQPPTSSYRANVKLIIVTNLTGSSANYSIWVNPVGSSMGDQNALFKSCALAANNTEILPLENSPIPLIGSSAAISVATSTGSALTFTIIGDEIEEL